MLGNKTNSREEVRKELQKLLFRKGGGDDTKL